MYLEIISSERKSFNDKNANIFIQGKKIDFNNDSPEYENRNKENIQNVQNFSLCFSDKSRNNINNGLINQNNINITNNNINYINHEIKPHNNPPQIINNSSQLIDNGSSLINNNINSLTSNIKCTCSKTGCLKKYCTCFSKGIFCNGCNCKNCDNQPKPNTSRGNLEKTNNYMDSQMTNNKNQITICNCPKSHCLKKYCECFKQGLNCNSLCRCILCNNTDNENNGIKNDNNVGDKNNTNQGINNLNNINIEKNPNNTLNFPKKLGKILDSRTINSFQFEAFCIYVEEEKIKIDLRKMNANCINSMNIKENVYKDLNQTPKFTNKKRLRKSDISNIKTCPTTNSSNKKIEGLCNVNKNIKKKKLLLN